MPYLNQSRTYATSSRKHAVYWGDNSQNRIQPTDTVYQSWRRDTIYGYRSKGVSPSGQSLEYENLSGTDLRNEIIAQGHRSSQYDTGHPAKISHDYVDLSGVYGTLPFTFGGKSGWYHGDIVWWPSTSGSPAPYGGWLPSITPGWASSSVVNGYGTTAIKQFQPLDKSALKLLVSLVELYREGLPSIPTLRTLDALRNKGGSFYGANHYSGEFLNAQFGWAPMVSDLKSMAELLLRTNGFVRNAEKKSGISKRATGTLKVESGSNFGSYNADFGTCRWLPDMSGAPISLTPYLLGSTRRTVTFVENYTTRVHFSGAFQYHFKRLSRLEDSVLARAEKLLGLELTPEVAWQTQPWTWLLDWFANFGQIISIASNSVSDNSLMKYGYIMFDTMSNRTETAQIPTLSGGLWTSVVQATSTRYQRERATPYGFGINPADFTTKQWAILGALGLTRAPKVLRLNEP